MTSAEPPSGPRRARFPQDVPQIAQLVELGFAEVLDYASRKALRDVRQIAEMGVAAWSLARIFGGIQPDEWVLGSVWEEEGRVVGNVTLTRRTPERGAWLISNVAVHPNFRRRGIARRLARHAVDVIRAEGGRVIYLQVDVANESALRMYRELGFAEIGGRVAWIRAREEKKPPPPEESAADPCRVSLRTSSEWAEEFALYRDVSPDGTAWNTPLLESGRRMADRRAGKTLPRPLRRPVGRRPLGVQPIFRMGGGVDPARGHGREGGAGAAGSRLEGFSPGSRRPARDDGGGVRGRPGKTRIPKTTYIPMDAIYYSWRCPMTRFLIRLGINAVAIYAALRLVPEIYSALRPGQGLVVESTNWVAIIVLALIFGLVNAFVAPLLKFLTCPFILVTFGLFTLLINTFLFWLTGQIGSWFGAGFQADFVASFLGALIVTVVNMVLVGVFKDELKHSGK
jgi:putative membrane protein